MGKQIIFVDDTKDWREVVTLSLTDAGFDVIAVPDASEAMVRAEGMDLGLIILDLDLNGEDGLALMKYLQKNHPGVPVLLYTATEHDDDAVRKMLADGAHQYLQKGPPEQLIVTVGSYFL